MHVFGCITFAIVSDENKDTLYANGIKCLFLGYYEGNKVYKRKQHIDVQHSSKLYKRRQHHFEHNPYWKRKLSISIIRTKIEEGVKAPTW